MTRPIIAVDLDGVLAQPPLIYDGSIGKLIAGAKQFVEELKEMGEVVIWSLRCHSKDQSQRIEDWLHGHDIVDVKVWSRSGKPDADVLIDDRAVYCNPMRYQDAFDRARMGVINLLMIEGRLGAGDA